MLIPSSLLIPGEKEKWRKMEKFPFYTLDKYLLLLYNERRWKFFQKGLN